MLFLTAFVAIELSVEKPLVNLRLLTRRNYGIGGMRRSCGSPVQARTFPICSAL
jgi:hypothetical protein